MGNGDYFNQYLDNSFLLEIALGLSFRIHLLIYKKNI